MNTNEPIFEKTFASDFLNRYSDVVEQWKHTSDPLKRGFAIVLTEAANGGATA